MLTIKRVLNFVAEFSGVYGMYIVFLMKGGVQMSILKSWRNSLLLQ